MIYIYLERILKKLSVRMLCYPLPSAAAAVSVHQRDFMRTRFACLCCHAALGRVGRAFLHFPALALPALRTLLRGDRCAESLDKEVFIGKHHRNLGVRVYLHLLRLLRA